MKKTLTRCVVLLTTGFCAPGSNAQEQAERPATARPDWLEDAGAAVTHWLNEPFFVIGQTPVTIWLVIKILIILGFAVLASRIIRRGLERIGRKRPNLNQSTVYTLGRVIHYLIILLGTMFALSALGLDLTKFALVASALSVGIGFGLQTIINNFIAGLLLLFERSLKVGDFIELESGLTGEVLEINIRSTLIRTNDNVDVLVPNSEFIAGRVVNWTLRDTDRRVRVPFGVAYGSDKEQVQSAALEAAREVPHTDYRDPERQPNVWLTGFGDSSLDFELVVWLKPESVKRPGTVNAAYYWALESALCRHGLEIPFPQRDLHLRSLFDSPAADSRESLQRLQQMITEKLKLMSGGATSSSSPK